MIEWPVIYNLSVTDIPSGISVSERPVACWKPGKVFKWPHWYLPLPLCVLLTNWRKCNDSAEPPLTDHSIWLCRTREVKNVSAIMWNRRYLSASMWNEMRLSINGNRLSIHLSKIHHSGVISSTSKANAIFRKSETIWEAWLWYQWLIFWEVEAHKRPEEIREGTMRALLMWHSNEMSILREIYDDWLIWENANTQKWPQ